MASVAMQRDLVITLKEETLLNVGTLTKVHPIPLDLSRQIFSENALEKLTQTVFNHLVYYLVSIVDRTASSRLPWPLYDSKTERTYRNELSNFITECSNKGLLSPVMSSYLVNTGSYKVTFLVFQLSQLAVQRTLLLKIDKNRQKSLYDEMTEKYKSSQDDFINGIDKETKMMSSKFANYLCKKNTLEEMAETIRNRITRMEETYLSLKPEVFLDDLVDNYVKKHNLNCDTKKEILKIKNVNKKSIFFYLWLEYLDTEIEKLESNWGDKMTPLLEVCKRSQVNTEELIARQTGELERKSFTVEYNAKTDEICTNMLQDQVNSEQKYILKNIVKDNKLNFPNLIRGCLISMCFVLNSIEIGDEIYRFNEYLDGGRRNYTEIISALKILLERVMNAENRLETTPPVFSQTLNSEIPPMPDLSDLKMNRDCHGQVHFDVFTPWNANKHQFNLQRKRAIANSSFLKPAPRSLLVTPFHRQQRDDLMKSIISCRISAYDCQNTIQMQNNHNLSIISQINHRGNETIAECSTGFTKQQINRLLSTKKSSSTKKHKFKTERPLMNIKKGGLFNESTFSNESIVLTRSQSSPNLFENRDKRSQLMAKGRKLSIMKEDSPSLLEVSGIAALERDSHSTPQGTSLETSRKLMDSSSLPLISVTPETNERINNVLNEEIKDESIEKQMQPTQQRVSWKQTEDLRKSTDVNDQKPETTTTPKTNAKPAGKTSSLEKIINRFKKVRTSYLPTDAKEDFMSDIRPIIEEKENLNTVNVDVFTANKILLPDLLSPSCSLISQKSNDYLEQLSFEDDEKPRKPRESLGTALGVDHTFLDQFDLID